MLYRENRKKVTMNYSFSCNLFVCEGSSICVHNSIWMIWLWRLFVISQHICCSCLVFKKSAKYQLQQITSHKFKYCKLFLRDLDFDLLHNIHQTSFLFFCICQLWEAVPALTHKLIIQSLWSLCFSFQITHAGGAVFYPTYYEDMDGTQATGQKRCSEIA